MEICKDSKCPAYAKCTASYRGSACTALRASYGVDYDPAEDCDYCTGRKELALDYNNDWVMIRGGVLMGADWEVKIHYCPMCGRELADDDGMKFETGAQRSDGDICVRGDSGPEFVGKIGATRALAVSEIDMMVNVLAEAVMSVIEVKDDE